MGGLIVLARARVGGRAHREGGRASEWAWAGLSNGRACSHVQRSGMRTLCAPSSPAFLASSAPRATFVPPSVVICR